MVIGKIIKYCRRLLLSNCTMQVRIGFVCLSVLLFVTYWSRYSLLTSEGKSSIFFFLESRISPSFFAVSQRILSDCFSLPSFDVSLAFGILSIVMGASRVEHSFSSMVSPGTISIRCPTLPETNVSSKGDVSSTVKHAWPSRDNFFSSLSVIFFYTIDLYLYSTLTTT